MNKMSEAANPATPFSPAIAAAAPHRAPVTPTDASRAGLLNRVRGEYLEMPGLSLSLCQAQRMWNLRRSDCEALLGELVNDGFLARTPLGLFVRAGSGRAGA